MAACEGIGVGSLPTQAAESATFSRIIRAGASEILNLVRDQRSFHPTPRSCCEPSEEKRIHENEYLQCQKTRPQTLASRKNKLRVLFLIIFIRAISCFCAKASPTVHRRSPRQRRDRAKLASQDSQRTAQTARNLNTQNTNYKDS